MNIFRTAAAAAAVFLILASCITPAEKPSPEIKKAAESASIETVETAAEKVSQPGAVPAKPSPERLAELDSLAESAPTSLKESVPELAAYLVQTCRNDYEKARVIFSWIAYNIAYDTDAFFRGTNRPQNGESVLSSGMAVCAGYSDIFRILGDAAGLEVISISGHGKGYGYSRGEPINQNHAWSAARTEQGWILIDSTWGAGWVGEDRKFHREFAGYWFDVDPDVMVFTHLPDDSKFLFTEREWTPSDYAELPNLKPDVFTGAITPGLALELTKKIETAGLEEALRQLPDYIRIGFSTEQLAEELKTKDFSGLAGLYEPPKGRQLEAVSIPVAANLERNSMQVFEYRIEDCLRHALIYNDEWHFALRSGQEKYNFAGVYDGEIDDDGTIRFKIDCRRAGSIKLTAQPEEGDSFGAFIEYRVK